ncbi:MAG: amino acid permease [Chlamydiae bacterium]|nr:amino acid permease [Chlamydiota bacterium]
MTTNTKAKAKTLNVFLLTMISIATILSVRNWPLTAEYGLSSIFFLLLAVITFFIPVSLVAAELATGWPEKGGIFAWVKEAFGHKLGFLAVWLLWVENIVWYPTILSFMAGSIAYAFNKQLATNKFYTYFVILGTFVLSTLLNLRGMKVSGWISSFGVILGTFVPGLLIIVLGMVWFFSGHPIEITFSWSSFIPQLNHIAELAFLAGVLLGFCGMEMPAVHAKDVKNPQKDYPKAIFWSASLIATLTILGTLAVAMVIPHNKINLIAGSIEAIAYFLESYQLGNLVPFVAILLAFGAFGSVSTWTAGPCKGLLAAAESGDLPSICYYTNKNGMPTVMMASQGVVVALLSTAFLFMPDVNSSFWILTALTSQVYLVMYIIMFLTAIMLRIKKPHHPRPYKIPGGIFGMILVAGIGLLASIAALLIGFLPPPQLNTGSILFFESFLIIGITVICAIPFIILRFRSSFTRENRIQD